MKKGECTHIDACVCPALLCKLLIKDKRPDKKTHNHQQKKFKSPEELSDLFFFPSFQSHTTADFCFLFA